MDLFLYSLLNNIKDDLVHGSQTPFDIPYDCCSGGGPVHARVPIHAHPQFS